MHRSGYRRLSGGHKHTDDPKNPPIPKSPQNPFPRCRATSNIPILCSFHLQMSSTMV